MLSLCSLRSFRVIYSTQSTTLSFSRFCISQGVRHQNTEASVEEQTPIEESVETKLALDRYQRALELKQKGVEFTEQKKYDLAISMFNSCINGTESYLQFKHRDSASSELEKERAGAILQPLIGLAYAQQCIGRIADANQSYQTLFQCFKLANVDKETIARNYINYAELLSLEGETPTAIDKINEALNIIGKEKSELRASAISNLAVYYAIQNEHEKALPFAKEGYELFCSVLGKNNQYTEYALHSYGDVLKECGKEDQAAEEREKWEVQKRKREITVEENEIDTSSILTDETNATLKHFSKKQPFDPSGIIVSPELLEKQEILFKEICKKKNIAHFDVSKIESEKEELKNFLLLTKEHFQDIKEEPVETLEYQRKRVPSGLSPVLDMTVDEYHQEYPGTR